MSPDEIKALLTSCLEQMEADWALIEAYTGSRFENVDEAVAAGHPSVALIGDVRACLKALAS